jgi:hypothetical protein
MALRYLLDLSRFPAAVQYRQPTHAELEKMFDWVCDDYKAAKFEPIHVCKDVSTESREIVFFLVHLLEDASTDTILSLFEERGLRPALYEELLGVLAKYPDLAKQSPVVALGSVWHGRRTPYAGSGADGNGRRLFCDWVPEGWFKSYSFLAVRK